MKYAINYVLGRETHVLVVDAPDRDDAYSEARALLVRRRLFSASLQGSCRPGTENARSCSGPNGEETHDDNGTAL